jgi:hypothetical protein
MNAVTHRAAPAPASWQRALGQRPLPGRRFNAWALLLAGAAHLALAAAVAGAGYRYDGLHGRTPSMTVAIELKAAADPVAASAAAAGPAPAAKKSAADARPAQPGAAADARVPAPSGARYFDADEWTEAPVLLADIDAEQMLVSPKLTAQPLQIALLINEQGGVDKVEIEGAALPDFEQRLVDAAFAKARFQPARIRGIAVKSSMKIELKLENSAAAPALPELAGS